MNFKTLGILFGVAVATTVAAKILEGMANQIDSKAVAKDVASEAVTSVNQQLKTDQY